MYRGKVTAVTSAGVFVLVADIHPTVALGPCQRIGAAPAVNDRVLVADAGGAASPDLIVIGVLT